MGYFGKSQMEFGFECAPKNLKSILDYDFALKNLNSISGLGFGLKNLNLILGLKPVQKISIRFRV